MTWAPAMAVPVVPHAFRLFVRNPKLFTERAKDFIAQNQIPEASPVVPAVETPGLGAALARARAEHFTAPLLLVRDPADSLVEAVRSAGFSRVSLATLDWDRIRPEVPLFRPDAAAAGDWDCLVVASPGPTDYINAVRTVAGSRRPVPVFCDASGFEMCGSDLPLYSRADSITVYLYNHFAEHFNVRDPLQVRWEVYNEGRLVKRMYRFMQPNEVHAYDTETMGVPKRRDAFVRVRTWHPTLTRGRHKRFRLAADVYKDGSVATLHSAHDFGPVAHYHSETTVPWAPGEDTVLAVPDFDNVTAQGLEFRVSAVDGARASVGVPIEFPANALLQEVSLRRALASSNGHAAAIQCRYTYRGYGTVFWFRERRGAGGILLSSNHETALPWDCQKIGQAKPADLERHRRLEDQGILFAPLVVPLLPSGSGLVAGFGLDHTMPPVKYVRVHWFDPGGKFVDGQSWEYRQAPGRPVRPADVDSGRARRLEGGLLVLSVDWHRMGVLPSDLVVNSDLYVEDVGSGDYDVTELQDSWRNLPGFVRDYPRWMAPKETVSVRTNLLMRSVHQPGHQSSILALAGSGDLRFEKEGKVEIRFYRPDGESLHVARRFRAWTYQLWDMLELFPELPDFAPDGYGFVKIQSNEIDLNAYGILRLPAMGGVSVQHFWGY